MSNEVSGSNDDLTSNKRDEVRLTPENMNGSFDDLLDDLSAKMKLGSFASKWRDKFGSKLRDPTDSAGETSGEFEKNDAPARNSSQLERPAPSGDDSSPNQDNDRTRDFLASLSDRFPGVKPSTLPPSATEQDQARADRAKSDGREETNDSFGQHKIRFIDRGVKKDGPEPDAELEPSQLSDPEEESKERFNAKSLADESKRIANLSKTYIKARAAKIAATVAAQEQARRQRAEEKRMQQLAQQDQAGQEALQQEEIEAPSATSPDHSTDNPHDTTTLSNGLQHKLEPSNARSSTSIPIAPTANATSGVLGQTDSLEAVPSPLPHKVLFTKRGASIVKLSSGTRVIKNSMRSVRSTVDALNAGKSIDPTKPTIALFAALTLAATIVSSSTLLSTGKLFSLPFLQSNPTSTQVVEDSQQEASEATEPPPGAPTITSVDVISYNNDDGDHPELTQYLFDGDQSTRWQSRYFAQAELPEDNRIRLIIHLESESTVTSVTLSGPSDGGQVDLRVNDGSDPFATPVLTSSKMASTTTLTPSESAVGTTVTLDFVVLPTDDEGRIRAKVDEITIQ